jgi:hypothetical protein
MSSGQILDPITNKITIQYLPDGAGGVLSQQQYGNTCPLSYQATPVAVGTTFNVPAVSRTGLYQYNWIINIQIASWIDSASTIQIYATKNGTGSGGPIVPGTYQTFSSVSNAGLTSPLTTYQLNGQFQLSAGDSMEWYYFTTGTSVQTQFSNANISVMYSYLGNNIQTGF